MPPRSVFDDESAPTTGRSVFDVVGPARGARSVFDDDDEKTTLPAGGEPREAALEDALGLDALASGVMDTLGGIISNPASQTIIDLLSRVGYAGAGAFEESRKGRQDGVAPLTSLGHSAKRAGRELFSGLPGVQGDKRTFGEVFERVGYGEMGRISQLAPFLYSDTGDEWLKFQQGGALDATTRGTAGLALDIFGDPTTYLTFGSKVGTRFLGKAGAKYLSPEGTRLWREVQAKHAPELRAALAETDPALRLAGERAARRSAVDEMEPLLESTAAGSKRNPLLHEGGVRIFGKTIVPAEELSRVSGHVRAALLEVPGGDRALRGAAGFSRGAAATIRGLFSPRGVLVDLPPGMQEAAFQMRRDFTDANSLVQGRLFRQLEEADPEWRRLSKADPKLGEKFYHHREGTKKVAFTKRQRALFDRFAKLYDQMDVVNEKLGIVDPEQMAMFKGRYFHHAYVNREDMSEVAAMYGRPGSYPKSTEKFQRARVFDSYQEAIDVSSALNRQSGVARRAGKVENVYPVLQPDYDVARNLASYIHQHSEAVARKLWYEDAARVFGKRIDDYDPSARYELTRPVGLPANEERQITRFFHSGTGAVLVENEDLFTPAAKAAAADENKAMFDWMRRTGGFDKSDWSQRVAETYSKGNIGGAIRKSGKTINDWGEELHQHWPDRFKTEEDAVAWLEDEFVSSGRPGVAATGGPPVDEASEAALRASETEKAAAAAARLGLGPKVVDRVRKGDVDVVSDATLKPGDSLYLPGEQDVFTVRTNPDPKIGESDVLLQDHKAIPLQYNQEVNAVRLGGGRAAPVGGGAAPVGPGAPAAPGARGGSRTLRHLAKETAEEVGGSEGKHVDMGALLRDADATLARLSDSGKRAFLAELITRVRSPSQAAETFMRLEGKYGKHFPVPRAVNAGDFEPTMREHFGELARYTERSGGMWGDPVLLPEILVRDIEQFNTKLIESKLWPGVQRMFRGYHFINNWFKIGAYTFWPASMTRDAYSNVALSFLDIGVGALRRPRETARVLRGTSDLVKVGGLELTGRQWRDYADALGVRDASGRSYVQMTGEKQLKPAGRMARVIAKRAQIDNWARVQLWLNNIAHGLDARTAADKVAEFLFRYNELSAFEQAFMKSAIPFYVYPRKAIELHVRLIGRKPGVVAAEFKPFLGREDENSQMVSWEANALKIRLDRDGKTVRMLAGVDLPIRTLDNLWAGKRWWRQWAGSLSPLLKTIPEVGTGIDTFTGVKKYRADAPVLGRAIEGLHTPEAIKDWLGYRKEYDGAGRPRYSVDNQNGLYLLLRTWAFSRVLTTSDRQFREYFKDDPQIAASMLDFLTGLRLKEINLDEQKARVMKERIGELEEIGLRKGQLREMTIRYKTREAAR